MAPQTQPAPNGGASEHAAPGLLDRIVERQAEVASRYKPVMSIDESVERYEAMQRYIDRVFHEGTDYGVIPGTDKPTLLKPGAEKLCALFGYAPRYEYIASIEDWKGERFGEPLFYYHVSCSLERDGAAVGHGAGSCNSWEKKYRYRSGQRACAACGKPTLIKGKTEYEKNPEYQQRGAWICFEKKGGCGAKYFGDDPVITSQQVGQIANPDFADIINTVQKMAAKRALVAAVLVVTGLSDRFTQDAEDVPPIEEIRRDAAKVDTGGAPVSTRQAAENVAQRKIAEAKQAAAPVDTSNQPPRLPTELKAILHQFSQLKGILGDAIYYAILAEFAGKDGKPARHANEFNGLKAYQACFDKLWFVSRGQLPPPEVANAQPVTA